jgi:hypothetical protein
MGTIVDPRGAEIDSRAAKIDRVGTAANPIATLDHHDIDAAEMKRPRHDEA